MQKILGVNRAAQIAVLGLIALGLWSLPASSASASPYSDAVLANNPLAYYRFNETSGGTATNLGSLGASANGSYLGGISLNQSSYNTANPTNLGPSAGFDGSSGRVQIPDVAGFNLGTGPFSVEFWFNTTVTATGRGDLFTYKGGGGDFGIHSNSQAPTGSVSTYFNAFNGPAGNTNGVPAAMGTWHHYAVTRDAANIFNIYMDGALAFSGSDGDSWNIANDLLIGANHGGSPGSPGTFFNGRIDEVAIYGSALSLANIQAHIAAANVVPEPTSIGIWAMATLATISVCVYRQRKSNTSR